MDGEGQFDGTEVRSEVSAGPGDCFDDELADLAGERVEVVIGQPPQIRGAVHGVEDGHLRFTVAPAPAFAPSTPPSRGRGWSGTTRGGERTSRACAARRRRLPRGGTRAAGRS